MKVHIEVGTLKFETSILERSKTQNVTLPGDVRIGSPATLEVWCYGAFEGETGYIKISKPLQSTSTADMLVTMRSESDERVGCSEGVEEVAPVPCVLTGFF
jgi:hypothetical protein